MGAVIQGNFNTQGKDSYKYGTVNFKPSSILLQILAGNNIDIDYNDDGTITINADMYNDEELRNLILNKYYELNALVNTKQDKGDYALKSDLPEVDWSYTNQNVPEIHDVKQALDYLLTDKLSFTTFIVDNQRNEVGDVVNVNVRWDYNQPVISQTFNSTNIVNSTRSKTISGINSNTTINIVGTNKYNQTTSKNTQITFDYKVFYGVFDENVHIDTMKVAYNYLGKLQQFTQNAGNNEYLYFACPSDWYPRFFVGGFEGGFEVVASNEEYKHNNETTAYTIYKSVQANLGKTIVDITYI